MPANLSSLKKGWCEAVISSSKVETSQCGSEPSSRRSFKEPARHCSEAYLPLHIMQVRIWDYAQSPDEIRRNMFSPPDLTNGSLVGLYDFSEVDGGTFLDKSQSRNYGVLGAEHRAPIHVVSNAPVVTPCVVHTEGAPGVLTQLHELGLRRIRSVQVVKRGGGRSVELGTRQHPVGEKRDSNETLGRPAQETDHGNENASKKAFERERSEGNANKGRNLDCHEETTCKSNDNFSQEAKLKNHSKPDPVTSSGFLDLSGISVPACLEVVLEGADVADDDSETDGGSRVVHVDVLGSEEQCGARLLHPDSCWGVRTEVRIFPSKIDRSDRAARCYSGQE